MAPGTTSALVLLSFLAATPGNVNFDSLRPGLAPPNWTIVSPSGGRQQLKVRFDANAPSKGNVLETSAHGDESPLAIFDPVLCHDGDLSVKFRIAPRAASGAAGVIWRYQDPQNYYLLDFSASRRMIAIYRVRDGVRQQLRIKGSRSGPSIVRHDIKVGEWHLARVSFKGNGIKVYLGNRRLFEADDTGFTGQGKAGVVTSGTTIATFDDFHIDKKS